MMKLAGKSALLSAVAALSLVPTAASALDAFWVGLFPLSHDFGNAANWQVFFVPGSGDRATFSSVSANSPGFGTGTVTIDQLVISTHLTDANFVSEPFWDFHGDASNENLRVNTDVTLVDIGSGAVLKANGLDIHTPNTHITNNTSLIVTGSSTYTSQINLTGNGSFTIDSGNTLRGSINHQSTTTSFVSGLLDTGASQIINGGVLGISPTGHLFLNGGNHTVSNGILGFSSGGTMTFDGGAVLRIQSSGLLDLQGGHEFENGAVLNVSTGGDVTGASYLDLGVSGVGQITVDGSGSTLAAASSNSFWGSGSTGLATVTFSNFGTGTINSLEAARSDGARADVQILSGSQLTTSSGLTVGPSSGTTSLGRITVNGGTLNNVSTSIFRNGGQLVMSSGTVNFTGDGTFATGSTFNWSGGFVTIASGKTLNITGGVVNKTGGNSALSNGATLRITAGTFTTNSFFDIANGAASGTLIVDGATARFISTSGTTDWGQSAGNFATVTFANGGVGTYSTGLQISDNGGRALVNLNSNAQLNAGGLVVGGTASAATINIGGGTLNATNAAQFNNGALVNLTSGGLVLNGNTTFSTGATLSQSGGDLTLAAGQTLAFAGGVGSLSGDYALPAGSTLRVTNGGRFQTLGYFDVANGGNGTLVVDGTNSRVIASSTSYWGEGGGNTATVSFANSGAGTFGGIEAARPGASSAITLATNASVTADALTIGGAGSTASLSISGGSLNILGAADFRNGTAVNVSGTGLLRLGGDSTFSAGSTFSSLTSSGLDLANNTTVTFDGGVGTVQFLLNGVRDGQTLRVTNGGEFTALAGLSVALVGNGTLFVDGPNSKLISADTNLQSWGQGGFATVTFSSGGAGTYNGNLQIGAFNQALVSIQSGGLLHTPGVFTTFGGGTATINVNGGTLRTIGGSNVNGNATLNFSAGTVEIGGTLGVGAVLPNAKVLLTPGGDKTLRVGGLDIPAVNNGKVDLSNNSMIVDHTGSSPIHTIRGYLLTGRNGGNWLGNGVTSSAAAGSLQTALGYAEASSIGSPAMFNGYNIDGTTLLVDYTWYGDSNLDGKVNTIDFNNLAGNFGGSGKVWINGDFDYNATVDSVDFTLLAGSYGRTSAPAAALPGPELGSVVPEPATAAVIALLPLANARRRRS